MFEPTSNQNEHLAKNNYFPTTSCGLNPVQQSHVLISIVAWSTHFPKTTSINVRYEVSEDFEISVSLPLVDHQDVEDMFLIE